MVLVQLSVLLASPQSLFGFGSFICLFSSMYYTCFRHCIALHCIALHCIASHRIASHRIASHRIASQCNAMQYNTIRVYFDTDKYMHDYVQQSMKHCEYNKLYCIALYHSVRLLFIAILAFI